MTEHDDLWQRVAFDACGTTTSPGVLAERHDVAEDDVEHELGLRHVQACPSCGWWSMTTDPDGYCTDCEEDPA